MSAIRSSSTEKSSREGSGIYSILEKMVSPDDLLERVTDKQTFIKFVQALADERERAQEIENNHPNVYIVDGALGWKTDEPLASSTLHLNASQLSH